VPDLIDSEMEDRCYFADRCPKAMEECLNHPPEFDVETGEPMESKTEPGEHGVRCVLAQQEYDPSRALPGDYFERETRSGSGTASDELAEDEEVSADD
jgi:peptide/nickel transport system ATP-binding protein